MSKDIFEFPSLYPDCLFLSKSWAWLVSIAYSKHITVLKKIIAQYGVPLRDLRNQLDVGFNVCRRGLVKDLKCGLRGELFEETQALLRHVVVLFVHVF